MVVTFFKMKSFTDPKLEIKRFTGAVVVMNTES